MSIRLSRYVSDGNTNVVIQNTVDPSPSNDNFKIGTMWLNSVNDKVFICVGNGTGNAKWADMDYNEPVHFQQKIENFTAEYAYLYLVTPPAETTVTATLPSVGTSGYVGFRLENDELNRTLVVKPALNYTIEDLSAGEEVFIDVKKLSLFFRLDGSIWRIV